MCVGCLLAQDDELLADLTMGCCNVYRHQDQTLTTAEGKRTMAATAGTAAKATPAKKETVPTQRVKATKSYKPVDVEKLTWYEDPTTDGASWALTVMTVGVYLESMGVRANGTYDSTRIITTEAQRTILKITAKSKKAKMMRHVMRRGPVPTVIMTIKNGMLSPLDGLQRGDVHTLVAQALLMLKHDPAVILPQAQAEAIKTLAELGHPITDLDAFLESPMKVEIWRSLNTKEEDEKFGTWNLDQTPISTKHMTEILHSDLRVRLNAMGILTVTEKEKKSAVPGEESKVTRKKKADEPVNPLFVVRDLAAVQVVLFGYLTASRNANRASMLEERAHGRIHDKWEQYGDAMVTEDMKWFYHELLPALHKAYDASDSPAGKQIKSESETFTVPVMAALGYARQEKIDSVKIKGWQDELIEALSKEEADPLGLWGSLQSWSNLLESSELKGSVGEKARKLSYYGWRNGITQGMPFDWEKALRDAGNA